MTASTWTLLSAWRDLALTCFPWSGLGRPWCFRDCSTNWSFGIHNIHIIFMFQFFGPLSLTESHFGSVISEYSLYFLDSSCWRPRFPPPPPPSLWLTSLTPDASASSVIAREQLAITRGAPLVFHHAQTHHHQKPLTWFLISLLIDRRIRCVNTSSSCEEPILKKYVFYFLRSILQCHSVWYNSHTLISILNRCMYMYVNVCQMFQF